VEIDGGQHAESGSDVARTKYLEKLGFKVMRFWNNEVEESIEGVVTQIEKALAERRSKSE
jgi:adenine-specific DNA-methyltransferase